MSRYNEGVYSIEYTPSLYLDIVLFWPDDGFLQPKYVAKILKYCRFTDIQGGPKVGIEYIVVYSIITVYLLLVHPVYSYMLCF